jgi:hypothetical protein
MHLKKKGKKLVIDDGFERRTNKETSDPILLSKLFINSRGDGI